MFDHHAGQPARALTAQLETWTGSTETYFKIDATGANYELGLTGSTINIKGAAYTTSDRRLKDDVTDLDDATAAVDGAPACATAGSRRRRARTEPEEVLGFLAQESRTCCRSS